jgi:hypothetical protein
MSSEAPGPEFRPRRQAENDQGRVPFDDPLQMDGWMRMLGNQHLSCHVAMFDPRQSECFIRLEMEIGDRQNRQKVPVPFIAILMEP